ncbi:MAG: hypothetical protein R3F31_01960 [Verrucomicrobiales bacterium]
MMFDLSKAGGVVTIRLEVLRQGDAVRQGGAEVRVEVVNFRRVRAESGEDRGAGRAADRLLAVSLFENDASFGESIDVRGLAASTP